MTTSREALTANQTITCTITSLTSTSKRQSTAIDNTANLYFDAGVSVIVRTNASGGSASGVVNVYAYGWWSSHWPIPTKRGGKLHFAQFTYSSGASGAKNAWKPRGRLRQWLVLGSIQRVGKGRNPRIAGKTGHPGHKEVTESAEVK